MSNEITLGIRITADGKGASAEVKTVTGDIDKLGQSSNKTTAESQRLNDTLRNQTLQMASASQAFEQNSEAVTRTSDSVTKLIDRYDPLSAKLRQLQADFKALDQAASSGKIAGVDDARLDAAYAKIQSEIKAAQGAVSGFGASANAGFVHAAEGAEKAAFSTVGARRELMVMGHEAMSGNFSRIPGSMMVLAERTNFSMASIVGLGGAITAGAAIVVAFGIAVAQGAEESHAFALALIMTGDAAGTSVGHLQVMAGAVSEATGATQHFAAEVLAELASGGQVAAAGLQQAAQAAIDMERAGGPAAAETVKQFNELGKSPVEASLKLNESTHFLTESIYLQIKALADQGNTAGAAALAQSEYAKTIEQRSDELRANMGTLEKSWLSVKDAAKSAWDAMLNIGRPTTIDEALAKLEKMNQAYAEYQKGNRGRLLAPSQADILAQQKYVDGLKSEAAADAARAAAKDEANKKEQAGIQWQQQGEQYLGKTAQMWREISKVEIEGTVAGKSQAEIMQRIGEIQAKYADKVPAAAKAAKDSYDSVYGSISKLNAELLASSDTQDHLTHAQKVALDTMVGIQNGSIKLTEAEKIRVGAMLESALALDKQAMAQKDAQAAGEAYRKEIEAQDAAVQKANDSLSAEIDKLKMHGEEIGLSKEALDALILSRQDDAIAIAEQTLKKQEESDASAQELIGLNKSITLLKERRDVLASNQTKQVGADAAAASTAEWKKGWEETDKLARKVFDAWGVKGSNAAKQIGDTLKTALLSAIYEATIRPIAFQIYGSLTGGQGGMAGALSGGGSGMGNLLGMGQQGYSLYSGLSSGNGVLGTVGNWLGLGPAATTGMTAGVAFMPPVASPFGTGAAVTAETLGVPSLTGVPGEASGALLSPELDALSGTSSAAELAATTEAEGGEMAAGAGLMGTIGAAVPWIAAAYALSTLFSGPGGGPKTNAEYATGIGPGGALSALDYQPGSSTPIRADYKSDTMKQATELAASGIAATVKALGGDAAGIKIGAYYNTDPQGTAPDNVSARMTDASGQMVYNRVYDTGRGNGQAALADELTKMTLAAVQAVDLGPILSPLTAALGDVSAMTKDQVTSTLNALSSLGPTTAKQYAQVIGGVFDVDQLGTLKDAGENIVQTFGRVVTEFKITNSIAAMLGKDQTTAFGAVGLASESARKSLIDAAGGLDALTRKSANYYQLYYSDAERQAAQLKAQEVNVANVFSSLGIQLPNSNAGFRKLVEGLDLSTSTGRSTYLTLMDVASAFNAVSTAGYAALKETAAMVNPQQAVQQAAVQNSGSNPFMVGVAPAGSSTAQHRQLFALSVPALASGGEASPGWALVGEHGPELVNFSDSARVYTAAQTRAALHGSDNSELVSAIHSLGSRLDRIEAHTSSTASSSRLAARTLDSAANGGRPLTTLAA